MRFTILLAISVALSIFIGLEDQNVYATTYYLSDKASCQGSSFNGGWFSANQTCIIGGGDVLYIAPGNTFVINPNISLTNLGATIDNQGTFVNTGILTNKINEINFTNSLFTNTGEFDNYNITVNRVGNTILNSGGSIVNLAPTSGNFTGDIGTIINGGNFTNGLYGNPQAHIYNINGAIIDNNNTGSITNKGGTAAVIFSNGTSIISNKGTITIGGNSSIVNFNLISNHNTIIDNGFVDNTGGTINDYCGATFSGSGSISGNPVVNVCNIQALASNPNPRWGIDPENISGTAAGFNSTDLIKVNFDDSDSIVLPASASWGPATLSSYNQAFVGSLIANAFLMSHTGFVYETFPMNITVQKHTTSLTLNSIPDVTAGTGISAVGILHDDDANVGVDNEPITFTGTGDASGVLSPAFTQGLSIGDETGMNIVSCPTPTCTPITGSSINILQLHAGASMTFPPNTEGFSLTLQDMGSSGFQIQVTNNLGVETTYPGAATAPDISTFSPPPDPAGIQMMNIVSADDGYVGISEVKAFNSTANPNILLDAGFDGVATGTTTSLEVLNGSYSSVGQLLPNPPSSTPLTMQANFAGDSLYASSNSSVVSFNTIPPTSGLGGPEASGSILPIGYKPFKALGCSAADPSTARDGICDQWKADCNPTNNPAISCGVPYGVYNPVTGKSKIFVYPLPGSNSKKKDVFVEADGWGTNSHGTTVFNATYSSAIQDVINAFAKAPLTGAQFFQQQNPDGSNGIYLHVDQDETNLPFPALSNALNVWTDKDTDLTNDYISIKANHFGNSTEHPSLSGTQTNLPSARTSDLNTQTISFSGLSLSTGSAHEGNNTNAAADGLITVTQIVTLDNSVTATLTPPNASSLPTTGNCQGVTWGTSSYGSSITSIVYSGSGSSVQTIVTSIPFVTSGPINSCNLGTVSVGLTFPTVSGVPTLAAINSVATAANTPTITDTMIQAKAQAYHYALFVDCLENCPSGPNTGIGTNPSGLSEQIGGDMVVAAGPDSGFVNGLSHLQIEHDLAGTFMHELGHNLGLGHGGPQYLLSGSSHPGNGQYSWNCKPNYESIMSYSRQLTNYLGTNWVLNYSSGTFGQITPSSLSESLGLVGHPNILATPPTVVYGYLSGTTYGAATAAATNDANNNPGIDWDDSTGNAGVDTPSPTTVSAPVQNIGITGCNTYTTPSTTAISDFNDWTNMYYNFTGNSGGFFNGLFPAPNTVPEITSGVNTQENTQAALFGVANPQSVTTPKNTAVSITLTGSPSGSLTFTISSTPSHGTITGTAPNITYTPNAGFVGTDSFKFYVNNGIGSLGPATVTITVGSFSLGPISSLTVPVGSSVSTPASVNSLDVFSSPVTLSISSLPVGISGTFGTNPVTPPAGGSTSSTFTVSVAPFVTPTTLSATISGASGTETESAPVNITIKSSTSSLSNVISQLLKAGCIDNAGNANALTSKLSAAQSSINSGNINSAINTLGALLNQINAQSGKHISTTCTISKTTFNPVTVLLSDVKNLINSL